MSQVQLSLVVNLLNIFLVRLPIVFLTFCYFVVVGAAGYSAERIAPANRLTRCREMRLFAVRPVRSTYST
jgi:hypothetical protein